MNMRARTSADPHEQSPPGQLPPPPRAGGNRPLVISLIVMVALTLVAGVSLVVFRKDKPAPVQPPAAQAASSSSATPSPSATSQQVTVPPAPTVPSAKPTLDARSQAERDILTAYNTFNDLLVKGERSGSMRDFDKYVPQLRKVTTGTLLNDVSTEALRQSLAGIEQRGTPTFDPHVTALTLGATPTATIVDCMDIHNYEPFKIATGKSVQPADQQLRLPLISTAKFFARPKYDGRWRIVDMHPDAARSTC